MLYKSSAAQIVPQTREFGISAGGACRNQYFKVLLVIVFRQVGESWPQILCKAVVRCYRHPFWGGVA